MKNSKYYKKLKLRNNTRDTTWISKLLISIIVVLVCLIICNFNSELRNDFTKEVLEENMKFNEFNKLYNKFMGDTGESQVVSKNTIDTNDMEEIDGRYRFNYGVDSQIEVLKPGIIVFVGEKDKLGNTIIVQGNDGIDIWYSNVTLKEYSLYDYVSSGDILGISNDIYVTISIYKDGELLKYEEYI